jgi:cysteine synthase A
MSGAFNAIGRTPMVRLSNINKHLGLPSNASIYAKLEYLNVGGSKKDRIAKQMIDDAIEEGTLQEGQRIVELTSGNTGTGLAIVAACRGHPFTAVMSKGNSVERARMMRALGATVVLVDQHEDSVVGQVSGDDLKRVEEETRRIVAQENAFRADQFSLSGSFRAHYLNTGPECWEQSEQSIDSFVDFVGTGGTFVGISKYLKEQNADIKCFLLEHASSRILNPQTAVSGGTTDNNNGKHKIQGGGYSKTFSELPLFDKRISGVDKEDLIDGYLTVTDEEAIDTARLLARTEGIFGGFSAGANVAAAAKIIRSGQGEHVLALVCDSGLKYLSTDLYPQ